MAAINTPGLNPSVLVAPDYQTQTMQAQRRLELSQALQQQAMQDTPGNGGAVSWTQGLARLVDALASKRAAKQGYGQMSAANQGYANGLRTMFGMPPMPSAAPMSAQAPQMPQGAPPPTQATPAPPMSQNAPQQAPADPLAPLPDQVAPPQAAPQPPSAPPQAPTGGATPDQPFFPAEPGLNPGQSMFHMMQDPDGYWKNVAAANAPTDFAKSLQQAGIDPASATGRQLMQAMVAHQLYQAPVAGRPGGYLNYPDGRMEYMPQAPAPGAMPVMGPDGKPTGKWTEDPSVAGIQAQQAGAVAGAQAGAKAPFELTNTFENGQQMVGSKARITGGTLNGHYYQGAGALPSGPPLGQQGAYDAYGKHSADAFAETQGIANSSPQRVQSLREMQALVANGLPTGPTAAKLQQVAEEHGLTFLAKDNAFVFNKDAARFVAQSAADLGLNGSDARLGMMANASPNLKMTPQALKTVVPTMIGLEYAKMAKATAAASWAQHDPAGNANFETQWRQAYDPRMFTAYAQGGPQALAHAPANLKQQWLKDYRTLKGMGVDFTQFAQ